ncbi:MULTISPECIES: hypothetical protein [Enterobacteriaceae]|uniref:hypothetical protein n=1 Tax=Enterobacteriaceae TaxID=543 RepID=UPI00226B1444|nr:MULTISPECIES: hypothetical protein [Enterobacteriaceae]MDA8491009.1 hypothetical protein [Kluyvera sp. Awk 3]
MKTKYFSRAAALAAVLNGLVIAGNDLMFGIRSSLPMISGVIAFIFLVFGLFVWRLGERFHEFGLEIPSGSATYRALARLMAVAFGAVALVMACVLYGLWERILQGAAIFG